MGGRERMLHCSRCQTMAWHSLSTFVLLLSGALASTKIPEAMRGVWAGNVTHSPLGPIDTPTLAREIPHAYMSISLPDSRTGLTYIRHITENQLFMVGEKRAQYCFSYDHPEGSVTGSDTAPFYIDDYSNTSISFCWSGPRLPSHKANCTGCDCAVWNIT